MSYFHQLAPHHQQRACTKQYHLIYPLWHHPSPRRINKDSMLTLGIVLFLSESLDVTITCPHSCHNIIHILDEGNVLSWDFVLLQGPPHDISRYFVKTFLRSIKIMCKSFFCSLYLSISCLIKKIISIVDLPGMNPNWFWVTLVILLKRCSITLS